MRGSQKSDGSARVDGGEGKGIRGDQRWSSCGFRCLAGCPDFDHHFTLAMTFGDAPHPTVVPL